LEVDEEHRHQVNGSLPCCHQEFREASDRFSIQSQQSLATPELKTDREARVVERDDALPCAEKKSIATPIPVAGVSSAAEAGVIGA
jgi:hypothetical protein